MDSGVEKVDLNATIQSNPNKPTARHLYAICIHKQASGGKRKWNLFSIPL